MNPHDPTPTDIEQVIDATAGKPLPRTAAKGIADMQARLVQFRERRQKILDNMASDDYLTKTEFRTLIDRSMTRVKKDIREAEERLAEYQAQLEGLN